MDQVYCENNEIVSGGDIGAKNAKLSIMVGGTENTFNIMAPLFNV